jgi:hypothetical protein
MHPLRYGENGFTNLPDGKEVIVGLIGKGEMFGLFHLCLRRARISRGRIWPREPPELMILPRNSFSIFCDDSHELAFLVIGVDLRKAPRKDSTRSKVLGAKIARTSHRCSSAKSFIEAERWATIHFFVNIRAQGYRGNDTPGRRKRLSARTRRPCRNEGWFVANAEKILIDDAEPIRRSSIRIWRISGARRRYFANHAFGRSNVPLFI